MEKIFPGPADFAPVLKEVAKLMQQFGEHVHQVNTGLYVQGLLHGFALAATILTALWAFTRPK